MHVQPKFLTMIVAHGDLAQVYTTIHSVLASRYRNHEIVILIPYGEHAIRTAVARDFRGLPILSSPHALQSTLLEQAIERARYSSALGLIIIEAGTLVEPSTIHQLADAFNRYSEIGLLLPAVVRQDGSGVYYGAAQAGKWPFHLRGMHEVHTDAQAHFAGALCLVRTSAIKRMHVPASQDLAVLLWAENLLHNGVVSRVLDQVRVRYGGILYCDFHDMLVVPSGWFRDARRYVEQRGTWYDKWAFRIRYSWRSGGGLPTRLLDLAHPRRASHVHN